MTSSATIDALAEIIRTETAEPHLAILPETLFIDIPGWDSVTVSIVVLAAEDRFGVILKPSDVEKIETVSDMVALIDGLR